MRLSGIFGRIMSAVLLLAMSSAGLMAQITNPPAVVLVKGGTFNMGSKDGYSDELPVHKVTLSDYYIGKYEVTVAQYRQFCNETGHKMPSSPKEEWYEEHDRAVKWQWNDTYPIVNVNYNDALAYCAWLSEKTGESYTLPTEAQWEFAARGGMQTHGYKYSGSSDLNEVGWYDENTREKGIRSVGRLKANELGIFDMSGNAWEWCKDFWGNYNDKAQKDPTGPKTGTWRVIRGGAWYNVDDMSRVTSRDGPLPTFTNFYYGFRVAKSAKK